MLEVVFNDSEKGSMKIAKNYDENNMRGCAVGYIGEKPSKAALDEHFKGKPIGGNSQDVVCIGFSLDIGDVSGEIDGSERQSVLKKSWGRFGFTREDLEKFFHNQREDLDKLMMAANKGTPIRIWKSNAPYSTCGFNYVCHLLRHIDCEIRVISLPEYVVESQSNIVRYSQWGQIPAGKLYQFLPLENQLTPSEKIMFGNQWCDLITENAPLRAIVNGKLISVPEEHYDFIISKYIPNGEFIMARLLGDILGKFDLGVSDSWYALRIEQMIEDKKLILVEHKDLSHPYGMVLRKA